jgi:DNA-binding LytR/AlgR family response regulator
VTRVLIVDDEAPARLGLRAMLAAFPAVQVIGEAASATEAEVLIRAIDYDAVFLDIHLPGGSGLELARRLQARPKRPRVIFATAHPEYALDAFAVGAVDYLLKPFDEARLGLALTRLHDDRAPAALPSARIPAERGNRTVLTRVEEIIYAYAKDEEVWLKLRGEELPCRRYTLRELEARLAPHGFLRVHRRYLVNLAEVAEVSTLHKTGMSVIVRDQTGSEIPVSRNLMPVIKQRLGL